MKYLILIISVLFPTYVLFSQNNPNTKFILEGKIIGQDTGFVHIGYFNSSNIYTDDSCYIKTGEFHFAGYINGATRASFYWRRKSRSVDDPNWTEIFIEPGNLTAIVKVDEFKKTEIRGSTSQNDFKTYNNQIDSLNIHWENVFNELKTAKKLNDSIKIEKIYNEQLPLYHDVSHRITLDFIKAFPSSCISAYLLFNQINLSLDSLKTYYSLLNPSVQKSFYGNNINNSIVKEEKLQIGKPAPDFTQTDLKGMKISLKDFRGKFVLIDFWASWCVPCRQENPYLKRAYAKYHHKGFVIIGFSLDGPENKNAWVNAIKNDDLPWIQLCDFKVWNSELIGEYNYLGGKGIPANFLINPEGRIIAKDLRGGDVELKLSEFIK